MRPLKTAYTIAVGGALSPRLPPAIDFSDLPVEQWDQQAPIKRFLFLLADHALAHESSLQVLL